jgi:Co/Zn/Cd efflux system component
MSSRIKRGGIAGLVAAALLIISAILNLMSPVQRTYDSTATYLYLGVTVAAYIAVIVAVLGIHALHSGTPRYGRLGTTGAILTIAGYAIIAVVTVISTIQGQATLLTIRLAGAGVLLIGSILLGVIIIRARLLPWWCGVLLIVAFPLGDQANAIFGSAENLLLALLWGSMGVALLSRRQGVAESVATQPAQAA